MAISATLVHKTVVGDLTMTVTDVTCSTKYVSAGEAVTAGNLSLNRVVFAIPAGFKDDGEGTINLANAYVSGSGASVKLVLRDETPAEVASEAEIKKPIVRVVAFGK
jgi:hypothetical protein